MKKKILAVLVILLLTGCSTNNDLSSSIDNVFANIDKIGEYHTNNSLNYYDYYLPSDMSEDTLDSNSVVLRYNFSKIIMNLNVSGIINSHYYINYSMSDDGFFVDEYKIYEHSGSYTTSSGTSENYVCRLYEYNNTYVLHLLTSDMNYYGTIYKGDIVYAIRQLMVMAKNTSVQYDNVISDFSNKDLITYQKTQINLFASTTSDNTDIASMLVDDAVIGDETNPDDITNNASDMVDDTNSESGTVETNEETSESGTVETSENSESN